MEIRTFKIRLRYCSDYDLYKWSYIDELPNDSGLYDLRCEYNWLEAGAGYTRGSRSYDFIQAYNRVNRGFTDDDVTMEVEYKNGLLECTLIVADSFNKLVTCIVNDKLVTRTLFDWIKLNICGQVSDGIGENEIAYLSKDGQEYDVWLSDFITDEPTGIWEFEVGEPISIEDNIYIVNSMRMPSFTEKYNELLPKYRACFENGKIVDNENIVKFYNDLENLRNENIIYTANKLNELNK